MMEPPPPTEKQQRRRSVRNLLLSPRRTVASALSPRSRSSPRSGSPRSGTTSTSPPASLASTSNGSLSPSLGESFLSSGPSSPLASPRSDDDGGAGSLDTGISPSPSPADAAISSSDAVPGSPSSPLSSPRVGDDQAAPLSLSDVDLSSGVLLPEAAARLLVERRTGTFNANEEFVLFKVVMVGNSGVGKSSLLLREHKGQFDPAQRSTVGVDFLHIDYKLTDPDTRRQRIVRLQVWDTAGQERFRSLMRSYYRGAAAVMVMFSLIDLDSFDSCGRWSTEADALLREERVQPAKLLVANKADLADKRCVSAESVLTLARDLDAVAVTTSAKSGANVEAAFHALAALLGQHLFPALGTPASDLPRFRPLGRGSIIQIHDPATDESAALPHTPPPPRRPPPACSC